MATSLVGSIFGPSDGTPGKKSKKQTKEVVSSKEPSAADGDGALSNLFDSSLSALPEKPQHKALPPTIRAPKKVVEPPKKQRKRKAVETTTTTATATTTAKTPTTDTVQQEVPGEDTQPDDDNEESNSPPDANDRTIFVGNLPIETTRKSLAHIFQLCGKVESTRLRSVAASGIKLPPDRAGDQNLVKKVCANTRQLNTDSKSTAQGYVVFVSKDDVEEALKLNNTILKDHSPPLRLRVDRATPTMDASRSVFVGNLPYQAEEISLQKHFVHGCGFKDELDVEAVRIVRDSETMQCKGFGYVRFRDKSMVAVALQKMNESTYKKRELRVTVCGKRFKGRRGLTKVDNPQPKSASNKKQRTFEGKRAEPVATGAIQRLLGKGPMSSTDATKKHHRARGESTSSVKVGVRKAGVSKRAAAEAKVGKRIKQIQKRVSKGMGKARTK